MSGVDLYGIREGHQFGLYAVEQRGGVAARQVGAAYGVVEQYIAAHNKTILFGIKTHTGRRMPGGIQHLQGGLAEADHIPFLYKPLGLR